MEALAIWKRADPECTGAHEARYPDIAQAKVNLRATQIDKSLWREGSDWSLACHLHSMLLGSV